MGNNLNNTNYWKNRSIQFLADYISLQDIGIDSTTKKFLADVGLPLLGFEFAIKFIPLTYIPNVLINDYEYYLLGDFSVINPGISFVGVRKNNMILYRITRGANGTYEVKFLNSTIHHFVYFLTQYCIFMKNALLIKDFEKDGIKLKTDYKLLKEDLFKNDSLAM